MSESNEVIYAQAMQRQSLELSEALLAKMHVQSITININGRTFSFTRSFFGTNQAQFDVAMLNLAVALGDASIGQIREIVKQQEEKDEQDV